MFLKINVHYINMYLDLPSLLKVSDNVIIYDVKKRFIKTRLEYFWKLSIIESIM